MTVDTPVIRHNVVWYISRIFYAKRVTMIQFYYDHVICSSLLALIIQPFVVTSEPGAMMHVASYALTTDDLHMQFDIVIHLATCKHNSYSSHFTVRSIYS